MHNGKVINANAIALKRPDLLPEWHPTKNKNLSPQQVSCGSGRPIWWICPKLKHEYPATPYNRTGKKPTGCPYCKNQKVSRQNSLQALYPRLAKEWSYERNGGLTPKDIIAKSGKKYFWNCRKNEDHVWDEAPHARIGHDSGCPFCSNHRVNRTNSLKTLRPDLAKEWHPKKNGGKTPENVTAGSIYKAYWVCLKNSKHSIWRARIRDRTKQDGTGCQECYDDRRGATQRLGIDLMGKVARDRGGICLSDIYGNSYKHLRWKCSQGHEWNATPKTILQFGSWCPECASSYGERFTRIAFESVFRGRFKKSYPKWLKSDTGGQLELDGYSSELGVAFEHQGTQHYEVIPFFERTQKLHIRQRHDRLKVRLCLEHKVSLIEVPEVPKRLPLEKLQQYVIEKAKRGGLLNQLKSKVKPPNYMSAYRLDQSEHLERLQVIAKLKGGRCLSPRYLGSKVRLKFECAKKHHWIAMPVKIFSGRWCPECAGNRKLSIEKMRDLAKRRGGRCLSKKYVNSQTKLQWQCEVKHKWWQKPSHIVAGHWCKRCASSAKRKLMNRRIR
jgi:hypothetical protein